MSSKPAAIVRAVQHLSLGEPFKAERAAGEGLRLDPNHGGLRQVRGVCRHLLHRHRDAIEDLEIAMMLIPLDPLGLWCLADSYREMDRYDPCREHLTWLLRRKDCPNSLLARCAKALAKMGEDDLSLEAFSEWVDREPGSAQAHYGLARARSRLGHPIEAVLPHLGQACELAPTNTGYRASLSEAHASIGSADGVQNSIRDLRIDDIHCPHVASRIARALDGSGERVQASAWWMRAIRLAGGSPA